MSNVYKVRDKKTGLFYRPVRKVVVKKKDEDGIEKSVWVKSNLSKNGKIYSSDPRRHITSLRDHTCLVENNPLLFNTRSINRDVSPEDLELIEIL